MVISVAVMNVIFCSNLTYDNGVILNIPLENLNKLF